MKPIIRKPLAVSREPKDRGEDPAHGLRLTAYGVAS